jgi:rod shape-determining protein MreC
MKVTKKKATVGMIAIFAIALLFFLHYTKILKPLENVIVRIFLPIERQFVNLSDRINLYYQEDRSRKTLENQVSALETELLALQEKQSQLALTLEENEFLREQLNFEIADNYQKIIARVIGRSSDETINTITIDKGKKQGVVLGAAAVIGDKAMIGKIINVSDYNSVVLLVNDHNSQIAASILNKDKTIGIVKGEYGLGAKMQLIPQTETLNADDIVVTSGIENNIPRGLLIGSIDSISENPGDVFKEAVIKLPFNLNKISLVNILSPKFNDNQRP